MQQNMDNHHRHQGHLAEINMTPFVDVCLVLLIIFMVTAPFAVSGVNVKLPQSQAKSLSLSSQSVVVSVTKKGTYYIGKALIKPEDLSTQIQKEVRSSASSAIFISADEGVNYGKVMYAMAAAQKAGVEKIGMLGENSTDKK